MRRWPCLLPLVPLFVLPGCDPHAPRGAPAHASGPTSRPAPFQARPLRLEDVTQAAGIRFKHHNGAFGRKWFPETNGSGTAIFDYDGDGNPDVFLVNSRDWTPAERKAAGLPPGLQPKPTPSCLYRNRGDGTFEDVTQAMRVGTSMYGMGCAVGDYDNDGLPDLYVSGVGRGWLFHNEGGRRFTEVAAAEGVQGSGWGTSCAWVDIDRDGRLDLFVGHYVAWDLRKDSPCVGRHNAPVYCGPNLYPP